MTKKEVEQKIKSILAKDPRFKDAKITIQYKDKKTEKGERGQPHREFNDRDFHDSV